MSTDCNHNCSSCSSDCNERVGIKKETLNPFSRVGKVIGIVSGKGGVGKSMVTSLMASQMNKRGHKTAILDADITGPSIAKIFGVECMTYATEAGIAPATSKGGIDIMSINLLLENPKDPVIFRGPVIAGVVKQFWTDVVWQDEEYMFIDMPPGTGDVPLTVFQSLPIDGIIIVTSPQELVSMIVEKAVRMADMMNVPILGIVENMSYFECPDCNKRYEIFGKSRVEEIGNLHGIGTIAKMPINPKLAEAADRGDIEHFTTGALNELAEVIENLPADVKYGKITVATTYEDDEVADHFGHCKTFKLYEIEGGKVMASKLVTNEKGGHQGTVDFLAENGVEAVICGTIGEEAYSACQQSGIKVYGGINAPADVAVYAFTKGQLASGIGEGCGCHGSSDSCGGGCASDNCGGGCGSGCH